MANKKRVEFDSLGSKKIDKNKLWGAQTQRSLENFRIGSEKIPSELLKENLKIHKEIKKKYGSHIK